MRGCVQRPFEPRHIRQVLQVPAGLEVGEECRERASVLEQAGPGGRVGTDILIRRIAEEPLMDETADHGIGCLERCRERGEYMVPVDIQPRLWPQAVAQDMCRCRLRRTAK